MHHRFAAELLLACSGTSGEKKRYLPFFCKGWVSGLGLIGFRAFIRINSVQVGTPAWQGPSAWPYAQGLETCILNPKPDTQKLGCRVLGVSLRMGILPVLTQTMLRQQGQRSSALPAAAPRRSRYMAPVSSFHHASCP